jgi:hypothetical protein
MRKKKDRFKGVSYKETQNNKKLEEWNEGDKDGIEEDI